MDGAELRLLASRRLLLASSLYRAKRRESWFKFAGVSSTSEMSKLTLAIFLAYFLEKRAGDEGSLLRTFVPCMFVTGALAVLVVAEPDLGTAMMLAVACFVICFTAGVRLLHLGLAAAPALVGVVGLLIFVPWRMQRLVTFLNPWADPQDKGFQVAQSLIAVGSGGLNGLGFAQGKQKMSSCRSPIDLILRSSARNWDNGSATLP